MTNKRITLSLATILLVSMAAAPAVSAQTVPSFPTCANPQGTVKESFSEGSHGIAGNTGNFTGSDTVYTLSEGTTMQCFCADNGDGTQSNWWHATSLTPEEVQILKNQGWISVPNGALWGLADGEWLVFNSPYNCPRSDGNGDSDDNGSSSTSDTGGQVLAASTDTGGTVLGLASTGNIGVVYLTAILGVLSLLTGYLLRRFSLD